MINIEMINNIREWGFDIEKEYHITKAHDGIIGIKDHNINENDIFEIYKSYDGYLPYTYPELMKKLESQHEYIGDYKIYTKYLLTYDIANELISFSDYLGDEFENYLREYDIQIYDYELLDIEEFFEKYGIEIY